MLQNGWWARWVKDSEDAIYDPAGPDKATDWQRQVFLTDRQINGLSAAFEKSVGIAKRDVMQAIHAITLERPEPRKRNSRKDIVVRIGLPAVGGGGVLTLIVLEVLRLLGA